MQQKKCINTLQDQYSATTAYIRQLVIMFLRKACIEFKHVIQLKAVGIKTTPLLRQISKTNAAVRLIHMNVDDYLNRIGYKGSVEPNLENLGRLSRTHKATVPYTNVEFVNGTRKILDLEILYQRIVVDEGGGVCHELNGMFTWLLRQLGYEVSLFSSQFFLGKTKEWSPWAGHCFPFVNLGKEGTYVVDPGYQLTGPMKFEVMTPHVETHGVYRFRRIPDTENDFYLERHQKTVYNASGELLKQGPAAGSIDGKWDAGCLEDEASHWKATHTLRAEPKDLSHFQAGMDMRQRNKEFIARNLVLLRYYDGGYHTMFGRHHIHKLCPNPATEVINKKVELTDDEQIYQVARDYFNYEVKEKLTIFQRNLLDK